jgi:ABC-2 type transport system ATP-binding protein
MSAPLVVVEGLVRAFEGRRVVDAISFEVRAGEIYGFLGHNGAGKTTTVRLLCGVLQRDAGQVSVLGLDPMTDGDALRARVGVLTESPSLDERFSARENLAYFAAIAGLDDDAARARIDELLAFFELRERADSRVEDFSKGMKQKLAIARALLARPEIVFLDEPTSGLDPVASRHLYEHMKVLAREHGHAIFFTTHRLVEAAELCDRVAILSRGKIVIEGTPREIIQAAGGQAPLRLDVDDVARARASLAAHVGDARVHEDRGVLVVDGLVRDDVPPLVASLVAAGVRVFGVTSETPTLEDAYLTLHQKAGATQP